MTARRKTGGRPRGVRNRITRTQRLMILDSLEELGGVDYLVWLGKKHPAVWGSIFKETLPKRHEMEVSGDGLRPIIQVITGVPTEEPAPVVPRALPEAIAP